MSDSQFKPLDTESLSKLEHQIEAGSLPVVSGMRIIEAPSSPLPHPLKCSKCDYIATGAADSRKHYFEEH
jgi:hypothetical protein